MTRAFPPLSIVMLAVFALSPPAIGKMEMVKVKTAADSEAPGYESYKAMDGNPQTMWHTAFGASETRHPHEIVIDLGKSREISGLSIKIWLLSCSRPTVNSSVLATEKSIPA